VLQEAGDAPTEVLGLVRQGGSGGEHLVGGHAGLARRAGDVSTVCVTTRAPFAACEAFWTMSRVAVPWSSTAPAMTLVIRLTSRMRSAMPPIAAAWPVAPWMRPIWLPISSVARPVWPARALTSAATTEKPRLAGPRRLDGGVERGKVGLARDGIDDAHDVADLGDSPVHLLHQGGGAARLVGGRAGKVREGRGALPDLGDRGAQTARRLGDDAADRRLEAVGHLARPGAPLRLGRGEVRTQ
jgi:hypothetical protein